MTVEMTAYHEAGHAVMAHILGRRVNNLELSLTTIGTYNGATDWGRYDIRRFWDPNVPYKELNLKQDDSKQATALVIVAGRAAEVIEYRQRGMDDSLADFGELGGDNNDEQQLEVAIKAMFSEKYQEIKNMDNAKQNITNLAILLLEYHTCWDAINKVVNILHRSLQVIPEYVALDDVQEIIKSSFAQSKKETK